MFRVHFRSIRGRRATLAIDFYSIRKSSTFNNAISEGGYQPRGVTHVSVPISTTKMQKVSAQPQMSAVQIGIKLFGDRHVWGHNFFLRHTILMILDALKSRDLAL